MAYSLGTDILGAGLNGEKRLEMRYMVGCKDGGLSFVYRYARYVIAVCEH